MSSTYNLVALVLLGGALSVGPVGQQPAPPAAQAPAAVESRLEALDVYTGARRVIHRAPVRFEAPNWSRDGRHLLVNQAGLLYRVPVLGGAPEQVTTGDVRACNNDHGYSPDGRLLAISCGPGGSRLYVVPADGGTPRLLVGESPAYWHGWSPDGSTLAYVGGTATNLDIYAVPVDGGPPTRLTTAGGLDDGPDYTADGAWIYFNSERTGTMRIWRMRPDGAGQEQVTFDAAYADWFPHPSPDGRWLVWLSYASDVTGHPPYKDVVLRIMPLAGGRPRVLARLFGGQGTSNVPSWSPAGRSIGFVSYQLQ